jgi:hypothetical protein
MNYFLLCLVSHARGASFPYLLFCSTGDSIFCDFSDICACVLDSDILIRLNWYNVRHVDIYMCIDMAIIVEFILMYFVVVVSQIRCVLYQSKSVKSCVIGVAVLWPCGFEN